MIWSTTEVWDRTTIMDMVVYGDLWKAMHGYDTHCATGRHLAVPHVATTPASLT